MSDTDTSSMEIEYNSDTKKRIFKNKETLTLTSSDIGLENEPTSTELVATVIAIANANIDVDAEPIDTLTERNDQLSRQKSAASVNSGGSLEYFDESDYSLNIASAVANILAGDVGDVRGDKVLSREEMAAATTPSDSKRKAMKKKSKHRIRGSKSATAAATVTEKHFGDLKPKPKKSIINATTSKNSAPRLKTPPSATTVLYPHLQAGPSTQAIAHTGHSGSVLRAIPPTPLSKNPNMLEVNVYLAKVQEYINRLGYLHKGEPKVRIHTHMSMKHQTDTARQLIKAGDPIKCLHALVLGIHFTNCTELIERFTLNFRSFLNGKEYKHVVLGVYMFGFFGAIGISRDVGLQDKPVAFPRLSDLISEFKRSYTESGHCMTEVRIGGIIPHDPHSSQHINWRLATLGSKSQPIQDPTEADKIAKSLRSEMGATCLRQLRVELSPPLSIPGSQATMSTLFLSDLNVKTMSSGGQPRLTGSSTAKKAPSRTRASTNNLAIKKKSKN